MLYSINFNIYDHNGTNTILNMKESLIKYNPCKMYTKNIFKIIYKIILIL